LSKLELQELRIRFPDLSQELGAKEALQDQHLVLGAWQIWRMFCRGSFEDRHLPHFMAPHIVYAFMDDSEGAKLEGKARAQEILAGMRRKHALLGVPIHAEFHWTLLVFRRSPGGTKIRYYDSLQTSGARCLEIAHAIQEFLCPGAPPLVRRNRTFQNDATSCGLFVLHYWEGEVRQFGGQGWAIGRPFPAEIQKIRSRIQRATKSLAAFAAFPEVPDDKKNKKVAPLEVWAEDETGVPTLCQASDQLEDLKRLAELSLVTGLTTAYGCSRCRFQWSGCIS